MRGQSHGDWVPDWSPGVDVVSRPIDRRYGTGSESWSSRVLSDPWGGRRTDRPKPRKPVPSQIAPAPPATPSTNPSSTPLEAEQRFLDAAYVLLRGMLARTRSLRTRHLDPGVAAATQEAHGNRATLLERLLADDSRLALLLGRLDFDDGPMYVGRTHIVDEDSNVKVASWRAPKSAAFYRASVRSPMDVLRRRRIVSDGHQVVDIDDEVLQEPLPDDLAVDTVHRERRDRLAEALDQQRGGRMVDVISTLMPEQYELVAAPAATTLAIQGSPGSGKTAVGLHRAAFLLYGDDQAAQIQPRDVLVVGPNPRFLDYIHDVLPDLGEHDVQQTTFQGLLPVRVTDTAPDAERERLLAQDAVIDALQRSIWAAPTAPTGTIAIGNMRLSADRLEASFQDTITRKGAYGNRREFFLRAAVNEWDYLGPTLNRTELRAQVSRRFWPALDPERVVTDLLNATGTAEEQVPNELRALLAAGSGRPRTRAEAVLVDIADQMINGSLTQRFRHIIIDEVQELTELELQAIRRRARPNASYTLLGDLAQSTRSGINPDWDSIVSALEPIDDAVRIDLPTAYRIPLKALNAARSLLGHLEVSVPTPIAYRQGAYPSEVVAAVGDDDLLEGVHTAVEVLKDRAGSMAIVVPASASDRFRAAFEQGEAGPSGMMTADEEAPLVVGDHELHGLEFDHVIVVEPHLIVGSDGARGLRRLYVALTRCTKSLTIIHQDPLPEPLAAWVA